MMVLAVEVRKTGHQPKEEGTPAATIFLASVVGPLHILQQHSGLPQISAFGKRCNRTRSPSPTTSVLDESIIEPNTTLPSHTPSSQNKAPTSSGSNKAFVGPYFGGGGVWLGVVSGSMNPAGFNDRARTRSFK